MKAVVFYESADDPAEKAPLHAGPHRARWREFADRGELLMIGPFANALEDGAMGIFTTRKAAEEFDRGDPFVLHGWYGTGPSGSGTRPSSGIRGLPSDRQAAGSAGRRS
jgi:uncharacterized protein